MVKDSSSQGLSSFVRDKLFISLYRSLSHRNTALSDAQALTDTVIAKVLPLPHRGIVTTSLLKETVSESLGRFDAAAHAYYAAHHPSQ